jgi:hypothetical protein
MKQMVENPHFSIYISSIPQEMKKSKYCDGLYHENIYCQSGLTTLNYKITITHEAAHLFDETFIKLRNTEFQFSDLAKKFETAIQNDLKLLKTEKPKSATNLMAMGIDEAYQEMDQISHPTKEYFAFLLISEVISKYLRNPRLTEDDIVYFLKEELPETFAWYQLNFTTSLTT